MGFFKKLCAFLLGRLGLERVHVCPSWPNTHVKVYGEDISDINMIPKDTCEITHLVDVKFDLSASGIPIVYVFHDRDGEMELVKSLSIGESHRLKRVVFVDFLEGP